MGGRQTPRILVNGITGSGKSVYSRQMIQALTGKYRQMIIVNRKSEFADLCEKRFIVDEDGNPETALRKYRRVFFRVDGIDPRPFLNKLGDAIMKRRDVLLVIDEAHEFLPRGRAPKRLFRVFTGGREQGIITLMITQAMKSQGAGIDLVVQNQMSHLVLFRLQGEGDLARADELFPELRGRAASLALPHDGLPPELAVRNMALARAEIAERDPQRPSVRAWRELSS